MRRLRQRLSLLHVLALVAGLALALAPTLSRLIVDAPAAYAGWTALCSGDPLRGWPSHRLASPDAPAPVSAPDGHCGYCPLVADGSAAPLAAAPVTWTAAPGPGLAPADGHRTPLPTQAWPSTQARAPPARA